MPKITVIVPVYKVEPYLRRCVDSILNQTFIDFELILVDDGSPDGCGAICDDYIDSRITVIHQPNGGLSAARNSGIDWAFACSNSEWLSFIDSDDWVDNKYLEALETAGKCTKSDLIISGFCRVTDCSEQMINTDYTFFAVEPEWFFCEHHDEAVVAWGKLYRSSGFETIRYPRGKLHEDEYTTYKFLFKKSEVVYIPGPMYYYFSNSSGITGSEWSIKRMDALGGFCEQMRFFEENNYPKALRFTERAYLSNLSNAVEHLQSINKKRYKETLKELRAIIWNQRKNHNISNEELEKYYYLIHPHIWKMKKIYIKKKRSVYEVYRAGGIIGIIKQVLRSLK